MNREVSLRVKMLDQTQILKIKEIATAASSSDETKMLAQAVLDLNQSVHDLFDVFKTLGEQGALQMTRK